MRLFSRAAMAAGALAAVSGCGGIDDRHDDGARLLPPAPALGATLQEDAAVLRPMIPGATWAYEAESSTSAAAWRIDVAQRAFQDGVQERIQPSGGGGIDVRLADRHGDVVQFDYCELVGGGTTCDQWTELRSPVRVGDQVELVEIDDAASDRTGDGRPDRFEYVAYRRVMGEDTVNVPALGPVRAIRIDTFVRQRTTEAGGTGEPRLVEVSGATWYAPGVGIVLRHMDMPGQMLGTRRTQDQRLVAWSLPARP